MSILSTTLEEEWNGNNVSFAFYLLLLLLRPVEDTSFIKKK
jgi:hypothetical protein